MDILIVLLLIISLLLLFWQISNFVSVFFGSPYVKTGDAIIKKALKLANIKRGEVFYELGCGTGDVLIEASKFNVKAIGFEISPFYYLIAKIRLFLFTILHSSFSSCSIKKRNNVVYENMLSVDLSRADIVYCYLLPKLLEKLSSKFLKELKPTARVISIGFPIPKLRLVKKFQYRDRKIFIYSPISRAV